MSAETPALGENHFSIEALREREKNWGSWAIDELIRAGIMSTGTFGNEWLREKISGRIRQRALVAAFSEVAEEAKRECVTEQVAAITAAHVVETRAKLGAVEIPRVPAAKCSECGKSPCESFMHCTMEAMKHRVQARAALPSSPAGRMQMVQELLAPIYEDEDGVSRPHPQAALISREDALKLLELPHVSLGDGKTAILKSDGVFLLEEPSPAPAGPLPSGRRFIARGASGSSLCLALLLLSGCVGAQPRTMPICDDAVDGGPCIQWCRSCAK